eukprot:COSAG04_NODE_8116_length_1021_cov_1.895879_1_plen_179_part_00
MGVGSDLDACAAAAGGPFRLTRLLRLTKPFPHTESEELQTAHDHRCGQRRTNAAERKATIETCQEHGQRPDETTRRNGKPRTPGPTAAVETRTSRSRSSSSLRRALGPPPPPPPAPTRAVLRAAFWAAASRSACRRSSRPAQRIGGGQGQPDDKDVGRVSTRAGSNANIHKRTGARSF